MDIEKICKLTRYRDGEGEIGIIDEMLRESYEIRKMSIPHKDSYYGEMIEESNALGMYDNNSSHDKVLSGHYIKGKKPNSNIWSEYFITCAKANCKTYSKSEYQDLSAEGVLLGYELLIDVADGKFNAKFRKNFDFEINTIDDFRHMLTDDKLGRKIFKYLMNVIKYKNFNKMSNGTHSECFSFREKDGSFTYSHIGFAYFDKKVDDEENDLYNLFTTENEEVDDNETLFEYIWKNRETVFTKKQLEFIHNYAKDKNSYDRFKVYDYKRNIKNSIERFIEKNRFISNTDYDGWHCNEDLIIALEDILIQSTEIEAMNKLCMYLSQENKVSDILTDILYELGVECYTPIINYIQAKEIDEDYLYLGNFIVVMDKIQREYEWQFENGKIIYDFNKQKSDEKILKLQMFIEKEILNSNGEGHLLRGVKTERYEGYYSLKHFKKMCCETLGVKGNKFSLEEFLKELGYKINDGKVYDIGKSSLKIMKV